MELGICHPAFLSWADEHGGYLRLMVSAAQGHVGHGLWGGADLCLASEPVSVLSHGKCGPLCPEPIPGPWKDLVERLTM